jgi:cardiolipin synthase
LNLPTKKVHFQGATQVISPIREFAEQAFSRTAAAPLVSGNSVRILKDAMENYPAWLEAIPGADMTPVINIL